MLVSVPINANHRQIGGSECMCLHACACVRRGWGGERHLIRLFAVIVSSYLKLHRKKNIDVSG